MTSRDNITLYPCRLCGKQLPLTDEFWHSNKKLKTGFAHECKSCNRERVRINDDISRAKNQSLQEHPQVSKTCRKCGNSQPLTTEFWHRQLSKPSGFSSHCKSCAQRLRHEKYERNKEHQLATNRRWREVNLDRHRELVKRWSIDHPEKRAAMDRAYKERCPDKAKEAQERYRVLHRNDIRERRIKHYSENLEYHRERDKAYRQRHPEKMAARAAARRAIGSITAEMIRAQRESQKGKCWHCGTLLKETITLNGRRVRGYHVDHLIPIARGGTNESNNLVIACPSCNLSKGSKLTSEWNGRLF